MKPAIAAEQCLAAIGAANWDLDNANGMLRQIVRGKCEARDPRAAAVEYIDSAKAALDEARKAALKLPAKGGA